jgi:progressive ankylosis protein
VTVPSSVTTQRQILFFWLPLAASWLLMGAEVPVLQAAIARLADVETQLAAFGIVMSLEIAIESPVIMLLATSTALCTSARNYYSLRRFMIWINVASTAVALLVAFTPLYDFIVRSLMRIPDNVADAAQPAMGIMTLWTAAIGVRRFYQGVMIRHGQTRSVGFGTVARLLSSGGTGILLAVVTDLPGVQVGSIALMAGVSVEALFVALAVRPTVKRVLAGREESGTVVHSMWDIMRYHTPLAASSLLSLLAQPLIGAGLARMPNPIENLAAWPVVWGILFIFRSPAFALPETVIALTGEHRLRGAVRTFSLRIGTACTAAMILVVATPLLDLYINHVAGLPANLSRYVFPATVLGVGLPFINSIHSWLRGVLLAAHLTKAIYWGMGLNLAVTALIVVGGVLVDTPGAETAVIALTAAFVIEIFYLRKARGSAA